MFKVYRASINLRFYRLVQARRSRKSPRSLEEHCTQKPQDPLTQEESLYHTQSQGISTYGVLSDDSMNDGVGASGCCSSPNPKTQGVGIQRSQTGLLLAKMPTYMYIYICIYLLIYLLLYLNTYGGLEVGATTAELLVALTP